MNEIGRFCHCQYREGKSRYLVALYNHDSYDDDQDILVLQSLIGVGVEFNTYLVDNKIVGMQ